MSILDHIVLYCILFAVYFAITRFQQQFINKHYWQVVVIPIILYSIILGCRYGWGNDYLFYKFRFEHPLVNKYEDIGFKVLNLFIHKIDGNYTIAFISYSLIFIIGALIWIKSYKMNKYMIALFLPATLLLSTYTIRQSTATSFIFLAFFFLNKKKWVYMILMAIITYLIHPGAFLIFALILPFYLITTKPLPWKITIVLYVLTSLFGTFLVEPILSASNNIIPHISLNNKFQGYIEDADYWFSSESWSNQYEQSTLTKILSMAFHCAIIYLGYIAFQLKKKQNILYIYNAVVVGLIFSRLFFALEILRRIWESVISFYFIPMGYAFFIFLNHNINLQKKEKFFCKVSLIYILCFLILLYGRFIFLSPTRIFFWNKITSL